MKEQILNSEITKHFLMLFGAVLYAVGISCFITPLHLYSGGAMGFSQLIRTILVDYMHLFKGINMDISGIIYYILNVPLMIMAYKKIGRAFFFRTIACITVMTFFLSIIKINTPIIDDMLTSCVIGGIIAGIGIGFMLRFGGSGGGLDIIGIYITRHMRGASVGRVGIFFNFILYAACALMFHLEIAIYSVILSCITMMTTDRFHYQNIMIQVTIFTKNDNIAQPIMQRLNRGLTEWEGDGAYTHETTHILVTAISKYEMQSLRKIVLSLDPKAFIIYNRVSSIDGNFIKHL